MAFAIYDIGVKSPIAANEPLHAPVYEINGYAQGPGLPPPPPGNAQALMITITSALMITSIDALIIHDPE